MPDTTPERKRALEIQQRYTTAIQRLRDDRDLTDEARRRLVEEWTRASKELGEPRADERDRLTRREGELERRLFGLGGAGGLDGAAQAISARDAQDRAGRLTDPQEAAALLARAEQNGDPTLARAIAHHALQQSRSAMTPSAGDAWEGVLAAFVDARPHMTPVVEELAMIERLGERQVFSEFSLAQPPGVRPQDINTAGAVPA